MLSVYLKKLQNNNYLDEQDYEKICSIISKKEYDIAQLAGLLVLISEKSLQDKSLSAFVKNILKYSHTFSSNTPMIDLCGTGGDGLKTINISTAVGFILASLGVKVAKHGNRALSSKSGSSDVLSELNVSFEKDIQKQVQSLKTQDLVFFHAPFFHPLVGEVAEVRKRLNIGTVFNILGPLLHPNLALTHQLVGIYSEEVMELYAKTLILLGRKRALVVRGYDGIDEISICDKTKAYEIKDGFLKQYDIDPKDYGFNLATHEDIKGGTPKQNAQIMRDILSNKDNSAKKDIVVLNAMFALYLTLDIPLLEAKNMILNALEDQSVYKYFLGYINA